MTYDSLPDLPALNHLKAIPQWVSWKYEYRDGQEKPTKPPINPHTGSKGSHSNPSHWGTYEEACARTTRDKLAGVGYVLTDNDDITGADLDNVRDKQTGTLAPWAATIVAFKETYVEVSPSGTGLRIFWKGKIDKTIKNDPASIEIYRSKRFLTITGNHLDGTPTAILPAPQTEAALRARDEEFKPKKPTPKPAIPEEDESLNTKALRSLSAWVPHLFPGTQLTASGGYRVPSEMLGRELQEDLSFTSSGIKDFGLHDQPGETREGKRTPIDVVMEYGKKKYLPACDWLREKLGISDEGVTLSDFHAYMPLHNYIYTPSREPWPASSVNSRLGSIPLFNADRSPALDEKGNQKKIPANTWLDQNKAVEQMTWAPGLPMLIRDRLVADGGWIKRPKVTCLNLYRPPTILPGDPTKARPWLKHVIKVFKKSDAKHIVQWCAHRVQHPEVKVNHALVVGSKDQGIGKDTAFEPLKFAVGAWNFQEVSPQQLIGRFNGFLKSVVLRVNEARDLGELNRYQFYDHMKAYTAAPPDTLRVDEKNLREHSIFNCCGVIISTNHKTNGIYLPPDDRRHYVAWSDRAKEDFTEDYWSRIWRWYESGGLQHVAAYLRELDISTFDPKAPPPKTEAFWDIVNANRSPEDSELADVLDRLGNPDATTIAEVTLAAKGTGFQEWIKDRKNRRAIPYRFEQCNYVPVRNEQAKSGLWVIDGTRQVIYAKEELSIKDRLKAANEVVKKGPPL